MSAPAPQIAGLGYAVPPLVRGNDDPVFDWIKQHNPQYTDLFTGLQYRRVLAPGQSLGPLMAAAAARALADADIPPRQVDLLVGWGSVARYYSPNDITEVHYLLGLPPHCRIVPLGSEFTCFQDGIVMTDAMLRQKAAGTALVVVGANWTQHVDYHEAVSIGASDGAGAAVLSAGTSSARFTVVDSLNRVDTSFYGTMYVGQRPLDLPCECTKDLRDGAFTKVLMTFNPGASQAFWDFGAVVPAEVTLALIEKHGLSGADITLISHQTTDKLINAWAERIQPAQYLQTLKELGNMTSASVAVNFAKLYEQIEKDWVVLLAPGHQQQAGAVLLRRTRR
ncbi:3-oxoacyl-[acyl-carrier-protein] synthase III C-terminal domain-containing protein [Azospirillum sp. TSO22-1]|uniref:3-oxoacyl-[acyl-carrier-protein] synthase III C-terminal domain-containing protein n=1 Tax=Azospirillum sp. TSO22-1 TaxID=716789 RepID=UPI000D612DBD|nr:3-oxoacyl-[acyl-carrier-protein] synthase III C-terminal domain-containing protein [Azospirillum sp. TSO22-1]PWC38776.1 hypothetical protein TSO221_26275 [Azospirillum sp. TSO22-1]